MLGVLLLVEEEKVLSIIYYSFPSFDKEGCPEHWCSGQGGYHHVGNNLGK